MAMAEEVRTQVPGNIWKIMVKEGDAVSEGDLLFIMEVMKTEVNHHCKTSGVVSAVHIQDGQEGIDTDVVAVVIA
jgi:acetyl-CoA carboxylase biotin carboxyl carrier protein